VAYCIPTSEPFSIQIVQANGAPSAIAACPQTWLLLSGGERSAEPMGVSRPLGTGWLGATDETSVSVYALCASRGGLRSQVVTAAFNAHSSSHSYAPGGGSVSCPSGLIATSGGFTAGGDLVVASQATGSSLTGWSVIAGGDADVTIAAVCWGLQGGSAAR
jgi:hypothetical protein